MMKMPPDRLRGAVALLIAALLSPAVAAEVVLPNLVSNLVCRYDFDHPAPGAGTQEADLGFSHTDINLVNGGASMRVVDGAYPGSTNALQTQQINPELAGNDDWKAGIYDTNGVITLSNFSAVAGITLMGWVKPTGTNPNLNSTTPAPLDYYNAVGLFGILAGNSEGHGVRALLEVINVSGAMRLVALGRRIDGGNSMTLAATNDWQTLLPSNTWTHLTATFDFDHGVMALYRNGQALDASYTTGGDPWSIVGGAEPDLTSSAPAAGIKIGGSYPQNTREQNPFNGRFDDLMFYDRVLTANEIAAQYTNFFAANPPRLKARRDGNSFELSWPEQASAYVLESSTDLGSLTWPVAGGDRVTNSGEISTAFPFQLSHTYFRLRFP
jgi:hypothetical protein